jgi:hypothetical protein
MLYMNTGCLLLLLLLLLHRLCMLAASCPAGRGISTALLRATSSPPPPPPAPRCCVPPPPPRCCTWSAESWPEWTPGCSRPRHPAPAAAYDRAADRLAADTCLPTTKHVFEAEQMSAAGHWCRTAAVACDAPMLLLQQTQPYNTLLLLAMACINQHRPAAALLTCSSGEAGSKGFKTSPPHHRCRLPPHLQPVCCSQLLCQLLQLAAAAPSYGDPAGAV